LFWKKKKKVDIALDARHSDNRSAYRIAPDRARPIIISIMGNSFHALNVSGTGVAFRAHNFPVGTEVAATIRLPSEDRIFPVSLVVVAKQGDLCRCSFQEIHEDAENLLHSYILELQKRKIRHNNGSE
jgi:hypothetical protein